VTRNSSLLVGLSRVKLLTTCQSPCTDSANTSRTSCSLLRGGSIARCFIGLIFDFAHVVVSIGHRQLVLAHSRARSRRPTDNATSSSYNRRVLRA
jgi:hypothetical protein